MDLKKEIKRAIYNINYNEGRGATYNDVVLALPKNNVRTITRHMQKMAEEGQLRRPNPGKYVLPMMEIAKEPKKLDQFMD